MKHKLPLKTCMFTVPAALTHSVIHVFLSMQPADKAVKYGIDLYRLLERRKRE